MRHGIRFDTSYRALADLVFYRDIVNSAPRFCVQPGLITSMFTVTGGNLAWTERSQQEWDSEMRRLPWYVSRRHGVAYRWNNLLRRLADWRSSVLSEYSAYPYEGETRVTKRIHKPTAHWGMRTVGEE